MASELVALNDLCQVDRRHAGPTDPDPAGLPFVGLEHVAAGSGVIDLDSASRVGSQKSGAFRFDGRHVLYGKLRPYLNKVATPCFEGRCSTELIPLLPRDGVDRDYLAYLLRRPDTVDFVMAAVTGSRMPRADIKLLLSMRVPLPPRDEQRRIVVILDRAARLERLRAGATATFRGLLPTLFDRMFGDPMVNPMGWKSRRLQDLCVSTRYGTSRRPSKARGGVPVIRMSNVTSDGYLDCTDLKSVFLPSQEVEKHALRWGDILFNRTNSQELVGKTGMWDGRFAAVVASYFIRLRLDEAQVRPAYVWAFLNSASVKQRLFAMARGAIGQANINAREVRLLNVPVPPLDHQVRFARLVERGRAIERVSEAGSAVGSAFVASLVGRLL